MKSTSTAGLHPVDPRMGCRLCAIFLLLVLTQASLQGDSSSFQPITTLDRYCADCHNATESNGQIDFDSLNAENPSQHPEAWERVITKLRHRQMPPIGEKRPTDAAFDTLATYLENKIDFTAATAPKPGRTASLRRLTRTEYQNSIRDLLQLEIDVSTLLPPDPTSYGFDTITTSSLSPTLLQSYLKAAKKITQVALGYDNHHASSHTLRIPLDRTQDQHQEGTPLGTRGGASVQHHFPQTGTYKIQLRLTRDRYEEVEGLYRPHQLEFLIDGAPIQSFTITPPKNKDYDQVDQHLEIEHSFAAGPHVLTGAFLHDSGALSESERQPYLASFNRDRHRRQQPALYSFTIIGPTAPSGPGHTPSRLHLLETLLHASDNEQDQLAAKRLARLAQLAFRRPVSIREIEKPLQFYHETKTTEGFEAAFGHALQAILVNPKFLFRIESPPPGTLSGKPYQIPPLYLASRLSFFLWSSIPDTQLLEHAINGTLQKPEVLAAEVSRMLKSPKASALISNFTAQWLHLKNLESVHPDARLFLDFDNNLRTALRHETEALVRHLIDNNLSVLEMLDANYTFLNERLAKHYGIPHVYGSHLRQVSLESQPNRRGLLTHGSILTITSHANRTSPVVRGKWILSNILGTPPKPPPPTVPQLDESKSALGILSIREQMAQHRDDPACAGCHNVMDPLGFALEHFDAIGRWRTHDHDHLVDPKGQLPDGSRFSGAVELQQAILKRPELFVRNLTEKLLTFALGRGLTHHDAPAVRQIVRRAASEDYRFSALVHHIVTSTPFQMREEP